LREFHPHPNLLSGRGDGKYEILPRKVRGKTSRIAKRSADLKESLQTLRKTLFLLPFSGGYREISVFQ